MDDFGRINGNNMEDCIKNGTIILDDASPDPIQVEPGVIFDPSSSLVILTDSGQSVKFADAIKNGQLDTNKIRIHGLTIQEAIENKIVNKDLSEFDSPEGRMSVADAIRKGFIAVEGKSLTTPKNASDSVDMGKLKSALTLAVAAPLAPLALGKMLYDAVKKEKPLTVDKFLTPKELALRGAYDAKTGRFLNSGKEADFNDVCQIFDADTVVKDLSTGKFVPLSVAKQTLVDKSGNMTDPQTGRVVPFFQAVKMGWIASKKSSRPKPMMTLMEAVLDEILDPDGILTLDGEKFEIGSAVLDGILDPNEIQVKDRKEYIPIEQAVEVGLVDLVQNRFGTTTLTEGFKNGLVRNRDPPISLVAVIRNFGNLVDPLTSKPIKLVESIDRRIVDPEISLVQIDDNVWSPIEASLPKNDIPQEILDDLKTALQENKIKTEMEPKSLIDLILGRYYRPKTGQILDPRTGFTVTVRTGLQNGLIDPSKTKFRDPKNDQILNFDQAGELLDPEKGILTYPNKMTLDVAYRKGYILPSEPPMTLPEAVLQGLAQDGGLILRGKVISLRKSLETGQILDNPCLVFENELVTPSEAIENGAMDPETGNFRGLPLDKALLAGFLVPKKTFTIKEAIEAGIYSPKSGLFNGGITTATAIRLGLLDPETTIVRTESGPEIFKNVADTSTGRISTLKGELNFEQALQKGILTDIPKPLGLAQAFDEIFVNGRFLDPKTGRYLTLSQAVDEELIDGDSKIKTGSEVLPLKLALAQNLIDPSKLEQMRDAVIEEPKESGVALQFLLKNSLYSPESGKLLISGKELSLNRAIRESKVDPERALCLGPDGKLVSLKEAILENKIDPRLGQFVEQNLSIPLDAAMDLELIHDLDNIGLYEAVVGGVQDSEKINPDISRLRGPDAKYVSLKEARSLNLVPEDLEQAVLDGSLVPSKTPMDLEVALKSKLMVPQGFVDPTTNAVNSLQKSVNKMVINPKTTLLKAKTLDVALEENLVGPDGVKQIEGVVPLEEAFQSGILKTVPESLQHRAARLKIALKAKCKLHDAISCGFLDPKSSTVKNVGPLTKMLESGRISLDAAGVMDTIEGTFTGDDFVVVQGIAVSFMDAIKTGRLDPESGLYQGEKKLSIREAVNAGILDPNSLILKDTARRRFVKFPEAFKRGIVDERGNVLDRANSKLYNLKSGLENQIVYVEKISILDALDCGVYNPTNGLFTDPFTAEIGLSRKRLDLSASLGSGLLDGNSAFVKTENGQILTVKDAIAKGILDVEHGRYKLEGGESIDLIKAKDRGLIIRSENRQAMEEKYKLCDDSLRQLLDWITEIEIRLANQEPANEHLDGIRNQINLLKIRDSSFLRLAGKGEAPRFGKRAIGRRRLASERRWRRRTDQRRDRAPGRPQSVDVALASGQVLAGTAAPGVSTAAVEKECEKLAEKWASVKERMVERERRLDVGLLQSGKFQEAVEGLSKWLTDTEEMVANQRPPSSDYKVVKAQLQEQKVRKNNFLSFFIARKIDFNLLFWFRQFLKKMLLDRQGSMSSLVAMGREVAANCDAAERAGIERQLRSLAERFEDLSDKAATRMTALEQAMGVAKEFQDKLNPIVDWLDRTEKKIKDMELVPTDEEKIQQKIREHNVSVSAQCRKFVRGLTFQTRKPNIRFFQALHDDILRQKNALSDLTEVASELAGLVGEDEAAAVADKVQEVADRDFKPARKRRFNRGCWFGAHAKHLVRRGHPAQRQIGLVAAKVQPVDHQGRRFAQTDAGLWIWICYEFSFCEHLFAGILYFSMVKCSSRKRFRWSSSSTMRTTVLRIGCTVQKLRSNRRNLARSPYKPWKWTLKVLGDVDSLLEWFREVEAQLREAEPPSSEPHVIRLQLKEHKALNDDIASQKGRVRDVLDTAKKVLRESPQYEDNSLMRDKMADLRETMDSVWASSGDRLSLLEQALALAQHFDSSHSELVSWLEERENEAKNLRPSMLRPQALMQDQAVTQRLLQSISEHKPLVDKLNKTGEALIKLVQYDEGQKVQEILDSDNQRYTALRNLLKARQEALEKALQESSEFSDKLEGMLRALTNAADEMSSAEPISTEKWTNCNSCGTTSMRRPNREINRSTMPSKLLL
ncbi:unnamed protein product, partial [Nesidiocoris tenuis]